ncbi:unnamed protein product [Amoebophrya sp. A25]|nr:unnamed protein product [Amoebophrya sp. A25]|eukprot:GSA25T00001726001.1
MRLLTHERGSEVRSRGSACQFSCEQSERDLEDVGQSSGSIPRLLMKDPLEWTGTEVACWLQWLGLEHVSKSFRHFDGAGLIELASANGIRGDGTTDPAWRKLTIAQRETLQQAIVPLLQYNSGSASPPPSRGVDIADLAGIDTFSSRRLTYYVEDSTSRESSSSRMRSSFSRNEQSDGAPSAEAVGPNICRAIAQEGGASSSSGSRRLVLKVIEGPLSGASFDLDSSKEVTGGRHSANNDIVLAESFISRRHFAIWSCDRSKAVSPSKRKRNLESTRGYHQDPFIVPGTTSPPSKRHLQNMETTAEVDSGRSSRAGSQTLEPLPQCQWLVRDLGSTTGTFLMVRDQVVLADGMIVQVGATELRVAIVETRTLEEIFGPLGSGGKQTSCSSQEEEEELMFQTAIGAIPRGSRHASSSPSKAKGEKGRCKHSGDTTLLLSIAAPGCEVDDQSADRRVAADIAGSYRLADDDAAIELPTVSKGKTVRVVPRRTVYLTGSPTPPSAAGATTSSSTRGSGGGKVHDRGKSIGADSSGLGASDDQRGVVSIGRDAANALSIQDLQLSSFHAAIERDCVCSSPSRRCGSAVSSPEKSGKCRNRSQFVLTDRFSTNRSWLRLSKDGEFSPPFRFRVGDVLKVGSSLLMPFEPSQLLEESGITKATDAEDVILSEQLGSLGRPQVADGERAGDRGRGRSCAAGSSASSSFFEPHQDQAEARQDERRRSSNRGVLEDLVAENERWIETVAARGFPGTSTASGGGLSSSSSSTREDVPASSSTRTNGGSDVREQVTSGNNFLDVIAPRDGDLYSTCVDEFQSLSAAGSIEQGSGRGTISSANEQDPPSSGSNSIAQTAQTGFLSVGRGPSASATSPGAPSVVDASAARVPSSGTSLVDVESSTTRIGLGDEHHAASVPTEPPDPSSMRSLNERMTDAIMNVFDPGITSEQFLLETETREQQRLWNEARARHRRGRQQERAEREAAALAAQNIRTGSSQTVESGSEGSRGTCSGSVVALPAEGTVCPSSMRENSSDTSAITSTSARPPLLPSQHYAVEGATGSRAADSTDTNAAGSSTQPPLALGTHVRNYSIAFGTGLYNSSTTTGAGSQRSTFGVILDTAAATAPRTPESTRGISISLSVNGDRAPRQPGPRPAGGRQDAQSQQRTSSDYGTGTVEVSNLDGAPGYQKLQQREDENLCKICFDAELNTCLYPCGHVVCCQRCSTQITECPVCRNSIGEVIKLYRV